MSTGGYLLMRVCRELWQDMNHLEVIMEVQRRETGDFKVTISGKKPDMNHLISREYITTSPWAIIDKQSYLNHDLANDPIIRDQIKDGLANSLHEGFKLHLNQEKLYYQDELGEGCYVFNECLDVSHKLESRDNHDLQIWSLFSLNRADSFQKATEILSDNSEFLKASILFYLEEVRQATQQITSLRFELESLLNHEKTPEIAKFRMEFVEERLDVLARHFDCHLNADEVRLPEDAIWSLLQGLKRMVAAMKDGASLVALVDLLPLKEEVWRFEDCFEELSSKEYNPENFSEQVFPEAMFISKLNQEKLRTYWRDELERLKSKIEKNEVLKEEASKRGMFWRFISCREFLQSAFKILNRDLLSNEWVLDSRGRVTAILNQGDIESDCERIDVIRNEVYVYRGSQLELHRTDRSVKTVEYHHEGEAIGVNAYQPSMKSYGQFRGLLSNTEQTVYSVNLQAFAEQPPHDVGLVYSSNQDFRRIVDFCFDGNEAIIVEHRPDQQNPDYGSKIFLVYATPEGIVNQESVDDLYAKSAEFNLLENSKNITAIQVVAQKKSQDLFLCSKFSSDQYFLSWFRFIQTEWKPVSTQPIDFRTFLSDPEISYIAEQSLFLMNLRHPCFLAFSKDLEYQLFMFHKDKIISSAVRYIPRISDSMKFETASDVVDFSKRKSRNQKVFLVAKDREDKTAYHFFEFFVKF